MTARLGRRRTVRSLTRRIVPGAVAAAALLLPATGALASGGNPATGGTTAGGADVQVSASASTRSPNPGSAFLYTFLVRNSGPDTATSLVLSDPLPTGTVYNYATANGSTIPCAAFGNINGGATVSCTLGDMAKGGQATVVVNVNAPLTITTFSNTGTATSTATDPQPANNSATVAVQTKASNKNGVNDPASATTATPCATLTNVSAPVGYYSTWAAIWNTFTVKSCSTNTENVNVEVTETNTATGTVDYDLIMPSMLTAGQSSSMVLDNDFAPFNTTYTIGFTATDVSTGAVLATTSVTATTPPPQ